MRYLIPVVVLLVLTGTAAAQEETPAPEPLNLSPAELSRQITLLGSRFLTDRVGAHETIVRAGEAAVPYLKEIAGTDNLWLRMAAVELLAQFRQQDIIPSIFEMLEDPSPVIKKSGLRAFEAYGAQLLPEVEKMIKSGELDPDRLPEKLMVVLYRSVVLDMFEKAGSGQYAGQYAELAKLGSKALPAILELLEEALQQQMSRENLQVSGRRIVQIINASPEIKDKRLTSKLEEMLKQPNVTPSFRQLLAASLARQGVESYYKEILDSMLQEADEKANDYAFCAQLALMYHRVEKHAEAEKWFAKCIEVARAAGRSLGVPYYNLACALAMGGKLDEAADALKKSIEEGYKDLDWLTKDRELDAIRTHLEYIKLLEKHSPKHLPEKLKEKKENDKQEAPEKPEENPGSEE